MRLQQKDYQNVLPLIQESQFNTMYALSVAEGIQEGYIYADHADQPKSVFIRQSCGFTYLFGDSKNKEFNEEIHTILSSSKQGFMFCVSDNDWAQTLHSFSDVIYEQGQRFTFRHDLSRFDINNYNLPNGYQIIPMDQNIFNTITGSVVPTPYWKSAEYFLEKGHGVCLINTNGDIVSSSFSACITKDSMDIGIQTTPGYEGHGYATITAARMVQYALDHNYAPVWGCNTTNVGSYSVAHKLGFINTGCWDTMLKKMIVES